jgi:hypothetical protein
MGPTRQQEYKQLLLNDPQTSGLVLVHLQFNEQHNIGYNWIYCSVAYCLKNAWQQEQCIPPMVNHL